MSFIHQNIHFINDYAKTGQDMVEQFWRKTAPDLRRGSKKEGML